MAAPLYWMVATSFKPIRDVADPNPAAVPAHATTANYKQAFGTYHFATYITNSAVVTVIATALVLALGTSAGYALARLPVRGKTATMTHC
ncbi:hypothetical protein ACWDWU_32520 [Streptomyces sp. NPDC003442]